MISESKPNGSKLIIKIQTNIDKAICLVEVHLSSSNAACQVPGDTYNSHWLIEICQIIIALAPWAVGPSQPEGSISHESWMPCLLGNFSSKLSTFRRGDKGTDDVNIDEVLPRTSLKPQFSSLRIRYQCDIVLVG